MSLGWQCGRCGTMYGALPPPPGSHTEAIMRAMTQKTILTSYLDLRRMLLSRCYAEKCPTTWRAVLWRMFGRRGHPRTGWRPSLREGLRSLRRGDPLMMSDNEWLRKQGYEFPWEKA